MNFGFLFRLRSSDGMLTQVFVVENVIGNMKSMNISSFFPLEKYFSSILGFGNLGCGNRKCYGKNLQVAKMPLEIRYMMMLLYSSSSFSWKKN
jgi:hypothetical protein